MDKDIKNILEATLRTDLFYLKSEWQLRDMSQKTVQSAQQSLNDLQASIDARSKRVHAVLAFLRNAGVDVSTLAHEANNAEVGIMDLPQYMVPQSTRH